MSTDTAGAEVASEVVGPAPEGTAVALISPLIRIESGLMALRAESDGATWDVETTAGDAAAREFRARCVKVRTSADAAYEQGNKPLLAAQRQARDLVTKIKGFVQPIEDAWDAKIKAREARKAAEKAAREAAEAKRVSEIRMRISDITGSIVSVATGTCADIDAKLEWLSAIEITDELFGDFAPEADGARMRVVAELQSLKDRVQQRELEAKRIEEQRAELARQQAELVRQQAEATVALAAQRAELERVAAEAAAEQKRQDDVAKAERELQAARAKAERERQSAELKRQRDAFEEEKRVANEKILAEQRRQWEIKQAADAERAAAEKAASDKAEAERVAAELAEAERVASEQAAVREAQAALAKAAAPKVDPTRERPDDAEILSVLCSAYQVPAEEALDWIAFFNVAEQSARILRETV